MMLATITLLMVGFHQVLTSSIQLPTFYWDHRNEIFHKNVCDGDYAHISVRYSTTIYFMCPHEALTNDIYLGDVSKKEMYENMFLVTKSEFDSCSVGKLTRKTRLVMSCSSPEDTSTIRFKRFYIFDVKTSLRFQFILGHTYYFIATSNGTKSGLDNRVGGRCRDSNMKLAMTVKARDDPIPDNDRLCYKAKPKPTTSTSTTTIPTTQPKTKTVLKKTEDIDGPIVVAKVAANVGSKKKSSSDSYNAVSMLCSILGGIIVGFILCILLIWLKSKMTTKSPPVTLSENSSVFDANDNNGTLRKEVANRMYFHDGSTDGTYRNSTEFKRLISESSASSSERHSVTPIGEYC